MSGGEIKGCRGVGCRLGFKALGKGEGAKVTRSYASVIDPLTLQMTLLKIHSEQINPLKDPLTTDKPPERFAHNG